MIRYYAVYETDDRDHISIAIFTYTLTMALFQEILTL